MARTKAYAAQLVDLHGLDVAVALVPLHTEARTASAPLVVASRPAPDGLTGWDLLGADPEVDLEHVGRKVPHVMSMAMVLDERALRIADDHGIFECAASYDDAVEREGRLSKLVLDANLNLGTMQHNYHSRDWRQVLPTVENAALVPNAGNFPSCPGVDLDIFYKEGWHAAGSTPHPVEFLFYKTNRGVGADALDARSSIRSSTKRVLLASHNFDGDGAPRYLLHAAEVLRRDHELLAWSFERDGPLRREFEQLGAEIIPSPTDEQRVQQRLSWKDVTLQSVLNFIQTDVDVIVFNTVLWANVIASSDGRVSGSGPRIMWILHEMEITEHSVPSCVEIKILAPHAIDAMFPRDRVGSMARRLTKITRITG